MSGVEGRVQIFAPLILYVITCHLLYAIGVIVVRLKQILKNLYNNLQFIYVYFSINLYADLKKECVQHILFKKVKIIYKIAIKGKYKGT